MNSYAKEGDARKTKRAESTQAWREENEQQYKASKKVRNIARRRTMRIPLSEEHKRQLREFYAACPPGHHVDHIHPLNGINFCGLHVPWNLQYLPALENIRKGNRCEE